MDDYVRLSNVQHLLWFLVVIFQQLFFPLVLIDVGHLGNICRQELLSLIDLHAWKKVVVPVIFIGKFVVDFVLHIMSVLVFVACAA